MAWIASEGLRPRLFYPSTGRQFPSTFNTLSLPRALLGLYTLDAVAMALSTFTPSHRSRSFCRPIPSWLASIAWFMPAREKWPTSRSCTIKRSDGASNEALVALQSSTSATCWTAPGGVRAGLKSALYASEVAFVSFVSCRGHAVCSMLDTTALHHDSKMNTHMARNRSGLLRVRLAKAWSSSRESSGRSSQRYPLNRSTLSRSYTLRTCDAGTTHR